MAGSSWLKFFGFGVRKSAKPDRQLMREIRAWGPRRILQIGLGDGSLAREIVALAQQAHPAESVEFVGMDPFDVRLAGQTPLLLRDAYRLLRRTGAEIRLIPGSVEQTLPVHANHLRDIDMVCIALDQVTAESHDVLWKFLPRMLQPSAAVYAMQGDSSSSLTWQRLSVNQLPRPAVHRSGGTKRAA